MCCYNSDRGTSYALLHERLIIQFVQSVLEGEKKIILLLILTFFISFFPLIDLLFVIFF